MTCRHNNQSYTRCMPLEFLLTLCTVDCLELIVSPGCDVFSVLMEWRQIAGVACKCEVIMAESPTSTTEQESL